MSREDLAKYPFTREAAEYVRVLDLRIDDLARPEYLRVIERAEERVREAILFGIVRTNFLEKEIEIISLPVAVLFVVVIGDRFLKRRYALAEAKRTYEILRSEHDEKLVEIARTSFNWKGRIENHRFFLNLIDYLRNSTDSLIHDDRWKLVNRKMVKGEVLLRKDEFARLLQEEIRKHFEGVIETSPKVEVSVSIEPVVERLSRILALQRENLRTDDFPKTVNSTAYPPCIKILYDSLLAGQNLSHMGRFTLTSFLLAVGIRAEDLVKVYTSISDFDERLTRYQVEHIDGKKGSRIRYRPPNCSTLKTHGLCQSVDNLCEEIRHPLSYYKRKHQLIKRNISE